MSTVLAQWELQAITNQVVAVLSLKSRTCCIVCDTTSMERIEDLQLIINHIVKEVAKASLAAYPATREA